MRVQLTPPTKAKSTDLRSLRMSTRDTVKRYCILTVQNSRKSDGADRCRGACSGPGKEEHSSSRPRKAE